MVNVVVTVYKDVNGICSAGYEKSVSGSSTVYSVEKVYMDDTPLSCEQNLPAYKNLLKIYDPNFGDLWIDETVTSFGDLVNTASTANPAGTDSLEYTAIADSQTVPIAALEKKNVVVVFVDNVLVSPGNYTFTSSTGTFVFNGVIPILTGSKILVLFN